MENEVVVQLKNICKEYPGVKALQDVSLNIRKGEVVALMGENGAGKSTLMKMLTGAEERTSGEIYVEGNKIDKMTPQVSEEHGIACVYQNLMLCEHLTVAENIWMGYMPSSGGILSNKQLIKKTEDVLERIGYAGLIDPHTRVLDLNASQKGMVAIVRAISRDAKVVIFDEPTAVLAEREVKELFKVIELLKQDGIAMVYISHRMEEIFQICDTITVLKDGLFVGEVAVKDTDEDGLIKMMVGRDLIASNFDDTRAIGNELLSVSNLSNRKVTDCSLKIHEGEIVGLYGLIGAGRSEFTRAIFGADPIDSGTISIRGKDVSIKNTRAAIAHGMSLVPEDRRREGLALQLTVKQNINLATYAKVSKGGFINSAREQEVSEKFIKATKVKTPHGDEKVKNLSGGNQQKVVLSKWLANDSHIFMMDEPTNGIDVGAKEEIYQLINKLAHEKAGILCVSSYMPEVIDLCDRILIMNGGRIVANVERKDFNEEALLALAIKN